MVSPLGSLPAGAVSTTGHRIAKLAQLQLQLSACEEQLGALDRQCAPAESKARDKQAIAAKITAIKAQIAELASDTSPAVRAAQEDEQRQRAKAQSAGRSPLDAVRLALVKEGHLGTLANLRA